jgi:23S rRNA (pseudouridine1915-N3)-methyltransferase
MRITVLNLGITKEPYLKEGIAIYEKRINHYVPFEMVYLNEPRQVKNQSRQLIKENEGKVIQSALIKTEYPVLLDCDGSSYTSEQFSTYIQQIMNRGIKTMGFIIGGSFGFSEDVYKAVPDRISLSDMTFSHQLIRLIFLEQLYRAFTIIKGEPYHHN